MRVRIDDDLCVGDGACVDFCPEVFKMVGDLAVVQMENVPAHLEEACREAMEACVVEAITIEE
jgi:ferredoxin